MTGEASLNSFVPFFQGPDSYVATNSRLLSENRARWLWRMHGAQLVRAGAAILVGGRVLVHPQLLDAELLRIFREQALARRAPEAEAQR